MGSLITSLYTGASGLFTSQTAVQVTGNNIANASTEGYSRQKASVVSNTPLTDGGLTYGTGSSVDAIERVEDSFVTQQLVAQNAILGEYQASSSPLADIEQILDISDSSLATDIDNFFDAWEELSTNPSGTTERQQVIQEMENIADRFNSIDQQLSEVVEGINTTIESTIPSLNAKLSQIAELNDSIMRTEIAGGDANTLRDERDLLVQEVSETCGASIYEDDKGRVCLQLSNGLPLVTGDEASQFTMERVDGRVELTLVAGETEYAQDYSDFDGELKGLLTVRDVTIPEFEDDIDRLAYELTTAVNTLHATGTDLDGNAAGDLFSLIAPTDPLADPWEGAAASMATVFSDPTLLAAGTTGSSGDNTLSIEIAALRENNSIDGATFTEEYARIAANAGLMVSSNEQKLEASADLLEELETTHDSITGVSTDEEMVLLIQYQAGYQAASHYLSVIQEMLDTLMQT